MPFQNDEQRLASFKHILGKLQVSPGNLIGQEPLESGHQIYSNELLSEANTIAFADSTPDTMTSKSVWTISSGGSMANVWSNGSFQKTAQSGGTNANFEEVILPLIDTNDGWPTYAAFISSSQPASGNISPGDLVKFNSFRLKNWVTPNKFGPGFNVKVYPSNADYTGPDYDDIVQLSGQSGVAGKNYGAASFDYFQGVLTFGAQTSDDPNLSNYRKPFWLKGYRYIGATGSAASSGGISEITATTPTNLTFDDDTLQLTLGDDFVNIAVGDASPYNRLYFNSGFAKDDTRLYSSLLINQDGDSSGLPYTETSSNNTCDNQLLIHTIHMPMGKGYSIAFTSSNTTLGNPIPDEYYFSHSIADQADYLQNTGSYSDVINSYTYADPGTDKSVTVRVVNTVNDVVEKYYNAFYVGPPETRLSFDVTSKTKGQIAEGLRDLINASCSAHVSASVIPTGSNFKLKVEQVYAGYNYYDKTIEYTGSNSAITHVDIVSGSNYDDGSEINQNQWTGDIDLPDHSNFYSARKAATGAIIALPGFTTSPYSISFRGASKYLNYDSTYGGMGTYGSQYIQPGLVTILACDFTSSDIPYANSNTLINGNSGQINPSSKSILFFLSKFYGHDMVDTAASWYYNDEFPVHPKKAGYELVDNAKKTIDFILSDGDKPYIQITNTLHSGIESIIYPFGFLPFASHSYSKALDDAGNWLGNWEKSTTSGSAELITIEPTTFRYFDNSKFSRTTENTQSIIGPVTFKSDVIIQGTLSASAYEGVTGGGGTGTGFPFTGSAGILGSLSASSHISASSFIGDGSQLTGVATSDDYVVSAGTASLTSISASGNISSSANIYAIDYFEAGVNINTIYAPTLGGDDNYVTDAQLAVIEATSGTNSGDQVLTSYSTIVQLNASSSALQTNINTKATTGSNVTFADITGSNVNFTSITASGNISASGNLYAALGAATSNARLVAHKDGEFITTRMIQRSLDTLVEDNWEISGSLHVSGSSIFMDDVSVTGDVSASGITTATSYVGSLSDMSGIIDGGTF